MMSDDKPYTITYEMIRYLHRQYFSISLDEFNS